MSKWRPVPLNCLYVIPDVHGQLKQLKLILKRILPLRKSDGGKDRLVMLGDYIDRRPDSHLVIDLLIEAKKRYGDQLILLKGNHEEMIEDAMRPSRHSDDWRFWMKNGGDQTLSGYLERAGTPMDNPYEMQRQRIVDLVPQSHKDFFKSLQPYYETDNHIFVHAGCDPTRPIGEQTKEDWLLWDRKLFELVRQRTIVPTWSKTIVTGHSGHRTRKPLVTDKFMMLDTSIRSELLVVEVNSMKAFIARRNKDRLVKVKF